MRTEVPSLLPFFRSELQLRLLGLLLLDSARGWTLDDAEDVLRGPRTSIHRELHRALAAGLVVRERGSRPHVYRAAVESPLYEPLKALLERTVGLERDLADLLGAESGVRAAVIHGSWAEGRLRPDSDVDVLVVGEVDLPGLRRRARAVGRRAGRRIDLTAFRPDEFRRELDAGNGFLRKVVDGPVEPLTGDLEAVT